jgi:hypothetical protein
MSDMDGLTNTNDIKIFIVFFILEFQNINPKMKINKINFHFRINPIIYFVIYMILFRFNFLIIKINSSRTIINSLNNRNSIK